MTNTPQANLQKLGILLPSPPAPAANYVPYTVAGNLLTISGQLPMDAEGVKYIGRLGDNISIEEGEAAARLCAINILAQANAALKGDLSRIKQVVKIQGFVHASPDFVDHPAVVNGASNLLADVLGEAGKHARAAVGMSSLPFGVAVEVDAVIEITD